ncbi:MAG: ParB/RepB/Spo0J family partition protein [Planctomycetota bacterium]
MTKPNTSDPGEKISFLPLDDIDPNPFQPRKEFHDDNIEDLARTISTHGLLSPIVVRPKGSRYQLISGERRYRAVKKAGYQLVNALVRDIADEQMLEIALIENIQRRDLNPIELANAFRNMCDSLRLTASEVAGKVGKKRESVANYMRLLQLEPEIQKKVLKGTIKFGHARALLAIDDKEKRKQVADLIEKEGLSVRQVEKLTNIKGPVKPGSFFVEQRQKPAYIKDLEEKFCERLGTKVRIRERKGKGRITIEFYTHEDFERIRSILGVSNADF